ncbi:MAG: hypothetical protein ACRDEB_07670 [Chitinophagaceae bacterium]
MPYARIKLVSYLALVILIYGAHWGMVYLWPDRWFNLGSATALLLSFTVFIGRIERKELKKLSIPFIK